MNNSERKQYWENVYATKSPNEVSWTQETPQTSLNLIHSFGLDKNAEIIDIGGGDSKLVDHLLEQGFENLTVLDISAHAIERAKERLGNKADKVNWIVSDVLDFVPQKKYDIWHDRAAFHFLAEEKQVEQYKELISQAAPPCLAIGTFSENGPLKCSGLAIKQYSADALAQVFGGEYELKESFTEDHTTPFNTTQNFQFVSLKKKIEI